jgi:hypothetical protein
VGKKLGNDYRLWIESATPGTYSEIKGQHDMTVNRQTQQIDTSSKDDFPYGTSAPGLKTMTINCEIGPDLPDANGYTRLETEALSATPTPVNFQIRKGGSAGADPADTVLEASFYIGDFNTSMGKNAQLLVNFTLTLAAAPTTDVLA